MLIPNLHLNQVSLIDQKRLLYTLAIRQDRDAFYTLTCDTSRADSQVTLTTWDLVTGKKVHEHRFSENDPEDQLRTFQRFNKDGANGDPFISGLHDYSLLINDTMEPRNDNILQQYFEKKSLSSKFMNQTVFVKGDVDEKHFYWFRMIKIIDYKTVKELYRFLHPRYAE